MYFNSVVLHFNIGLKIPTCNKLIIFISLEDFLNDLSLTETPDQKYKKFWHNGTAVIASVGVESAIYNLVSQSPGMLMPPVTSS